MDTRQLNFGSKHKIRFSPVIIVCVVVTFITVFVIAYAMTKSNSNKSTAGTQKSGSSAKHPFAAIPNTSQPFTATLATIISGQTTDSTFQSDGNGNFAQIVALNGSTLTTIYTPDSYFVCRDTGQPCVKHTNDPTVSNVDPTGYTYTSAETNQLRATAKYSGRQKCPDGKSTCNVWFTTTKYNTSTYYYVDTVTRQIMQTIHYGRFGEDKDSAKVTLKSTYTYKKAVHIAVPTNYTDAPKSQ